MIDTHCHIFLNYYDNIDIVISGAIENGIKAVIVNGYDKKSNLEVLELIKKYDIVYGAIGFHPSECKTVTENDLCFIHENINNKKIVAVGEIGLDYHFDVSDKSLQMVLFREQVKIADAYNKPVIVHSRDAIMDTYDILKDYKIPKVLHCYSGSLEMAQQFIKINAFFGIGGVVTFKNAKTIKDVVKNIDVKRLLLETDSPYLSPEPFRGKINLPEYLDKILIQISEIKCINKEQLNNIILDTTYGIFDISKNI